MQTSLRLITLPLALAACPPTDYSETFPPECDPQAEPCPPPPASSSTAASSTSDALTDGLNTVTGPPTTSSATSNGSSSSSGDANLPPAVSIIPEKEHLSEAGKVIYTIETSADTAELRLLIDGILQPNPTPSGVLTYTAIFEALSAKDNTAPGAPHAITVEAEDPEGLVGVDQAELSVTLPASGVQKCIFTDEGHLSRVGALAYSEDGIFAAGERDGKAAVWILGPDQCELIKVVTIGDWDPTLGAMLSRGAAIAVDEVGDLAVGFNLFKGGVPQVYTVGLTKLGSLLWAKLGPVGDEVAGLTAVPGGFVGVGSRRTTFSTDAVVWQYAVEQGFVKGSVKVLDLVAAEEAPDIGNKRNEWARAAMFHPNTSMVFVVGDRVYRDNDQNLSRRAFVVRMLPFGEVIGEPSTSSGDLLHNDTATSIALCGEVVLLGGSAWAKNQEEAPVPLTRYLDGDGNPIGGLTEPWIGQTFGLACDRELKTVHAATTLGPGVPDAKVFAFSDATAPRLWYEQGQGGEDAALTLACDARGFCAWGGFRESPKTQDRVAVVRVHHP